MKILCSKIDYIEGRMTSIACKKSKSRLVEQLLHLGLKHNKTNKNAVEFEYDVEELANIIGTTKNYLYKLFGQLSRKGLISVRFHKIKILDLEKMFSEATGELKQTA
jgi:CRP-like cAMP-binding protein